MVALATISRRKRVDIASETRGALISTTDQEVTLYLGPGATRRHTMGRKKQDWKSACRHDGQRWRAEYLWRPTNDSGSASFATEIDARLWLAETEREVRSGSHSDPDLAATTFGDYFEKEFWPSVSRKSEGTVTQQWNLYQNHIKDQWGDVQLRAITTRAVKRWRAELPKRPYAERLGPKGTPWRPPGTISTSTQRSIYWVFHQAVETAVEDGYLNRSPMPVRSDLPAAQPKTPAFVLTVREIEKLALESSDPDLIFVLAYGGFRQGEAFALRVNDLDFGRKTIRVDEKVRETKGRVIIEKVLKTKNSRRRVPMPTTVMDRLRQRQFDRTLMPDQLLFTNSKGGPIGLKNWRSRELQPAAKRAGFEGLTGHDLRHAAASAWFRAGRSTLEIATFLGDTVRVVEETYVHLPRNTDMNHTTAIDDLIENEL